MTTIFWVGDSTVQHNGILTYPQTGIGQAMERLIDKRSVRIENHARNGRSTKSFLEEGRFAPVCLRMQQGDYLFIQFGHNDQKQEDPARYAAAATDYADNLRLFIGAAKQRGAQPVLITPVARGNYRQLPEDRQFAPWVAAMEQVGREQDVPVIPLTRLSETLVDSLGAEADSLYMALPAGEYPNYPNGQNDRTHLRPRGALTCAALIAGELHKLGGGYANLLSEEFARWLGEGGTLPLP